MTTWSALRSAAERLLAMGPPTTVRKPRARQRSTMAASDSRWMCIALISTTSAQARSRSRSRSTLVSTRRLFHVARQQRGDGHQPQRRLRGPLAHKLERMFEAPVGVGKLGIEQAARSSATSLWEERLREQDRGFRPCFPAGNNCGHARRGGLAPTSIFPPTLRNLSKRRQFAGKSARPWLMRPQ